MYTRGVERRGENYEPIEGEEGNRIIQGVETRGENYGKN